MINEAINNFYNKPRDKERKIGHYHASEINSIIKGYTNPTNFFKQKPMDDESQANVFRGSAMENWLSHILKEEKVEFVDQERLEMEIAPNVFISGKTDFSFKDRIIETKCPKDAVIGIPDRYRAQMEFYHRASGKDVYLSIFPKDGSKIVKGWKYIPSDDLWNLIGKTLLEFHNKLVKKYSRQI